MVVVAGPVSVMVAVAMAIVLVQIPLFPLHGPFVT